LYIYHLKEKAKNNFSALIKRPLIMLTRYQIQLPLRLGSRPGSSSDAVATASIDHQSVHLNISANLERAQLEDLIAALADLGKAWDELGLKNSAPLAQTKGSVAT
jgi:hypothetical protein